MCDYTLKTRSLDSGTIGTLQMCNFLRFYVSGTLQGPCRDLIFAMVPEYILSEIAGLRPFRDHRDHIYNVLHIRAPIYAHKRARAFEKNTQHWSLWSLLQKCDGGVNR